MSTTITLHIDGGITQDQEKTYLHLPFTMPAHAQHLEIAYQYTNQISSDPTLSGGNTIDLGLFDERGIQFLNAGFRGWSGSERSNISIVPTSATPGYLAGPLNPGQWHVLLGLYKVAPEGGRYEVTVAITTGEDVPDSIPDNPRSADHNLPSSPPPALRAPWLRGELHCHTWHSDGALNPTQLVARARDRGLDFLAASDHNSISSQRELEQLTSPGLVLLRGVEVTTFKGHFNVWGTAEWVDFRVQSPEDMRAALEFANHRGAVTSCGHPKPFGPSWDYPEVTNHQCVEVWNGPWTGLNELSLEYWQELLAKGMRISAVGGSDFHRPGSESGGRERDLGRPTNWVYVQAEPTPENILEAIRRGRVSISEDPDGPFLELTGGMDGQYLAGDHIPHPKPIDLPIHLRCLGSTPGDQLRLLDQNGLVWETPGGLDAVDRHLIFSTADRLYLRAELRDADDRVRALTNPIYLR